MKKQFYYAILLVVLLVASCVNDGAGSETSYSPEDVWEYNDDVAVLSKVIKELKNGSNGKKLENTFLKNDILWEESKFLFIDNKKRILVPFLSEDRSTVQGVLSLVKDAKGKTTFTITDRYQSMRENSSLPFWDGGTWLGYFLALDKDILGTENGSPGIATRPAKNKSENSLTMRMECSTQQTGETVFYRYYYTLDSAGEVSNFGFEITHTEPIYSNVCYDVPDPVIPDNGSGSGGSSGGSSGTPDNNILINKNKLCGTYNFKAVGNGYVVNIAGLGFIANSPSGDRVITELGVVCVTIPKYNFPISQSSAKFNAAWTSTMNEVMTYLNNTTGIVNPTPTVLKNLIKEFLTNNLNYVSGFGSGVSINTGGCNGVPYSNAVYCQ